MTSKHTRGCSYTHRKVNKTKSGIINNGMDTLTYRRSAVHGRIGNSRTQTRQCTPKQTDKSSWALKYQTHRSDIHTLLSFCYYHTLSRTINQEYSRLPGQKAKISGLLGNTSEQEEARLALFM